MTNQLIPGGKVPDTKTDFYPWQSAKVLRKGERVSDLVSGRRLGTIQVRWLVFFDLDNLYDFNKANGHTAGDQLINAFWSLLLSIDPSNNYVARYGGDEFVWLSGFSAEQLLQSMTLIREKLSQLPENLGHKVGLSGAYAAISDDLSPSAGQQLFAKVSECAQQTAKDLGKGKLIKVGIGEAESQDW